MLNGTLLRPFDQCQSVKTPRGKSPAWVCLPILPLACLTFYPNNLPHLHIHQAAQLVRITFIPHRTCSFSYLSEFVSTVQSALDFNDNIKIFLWVFRCLYTSLYYSVFIHFFCKCSYSGDVVPAEGAFIHCSSRARQKALNVTTVHLLYFQPSSTFSTVLSPYIYCNLCS